MKNKESLKLWLGYIGKDAHSLFLFGVIQEVRASAVRWGWGVVYRLYRIKHNPSFRDNVITYVEGSFIYCLQLFLCYIGKAE